MTQIIKNINSGGVGAFEFATPPSITDDFNSGFLVGDRWIDTVSGNEYTLIDGTAGNALWKPTTTGAGLTENNNFTGDTIFSGNVTFDGGIVFGSVYNTSTLTNDQDDFVIPDLNEYTIIVFNSNTNIDITGIDASSLNNTRHAFIFANGTTNRTIKFKKNDNDSSQVNRFFMDADISIKEGEFWWFMYNPVQQRWNAQAKI